MAARIPQIEQRTSVSALPGTPRASPPDAIGRALGQVGDVLSRAAAQTERGLAERSREEERRARILRADEDRRELVRAHVELSRFELDAATEQSQIAEADAESPYGHGERVAAAFDKRAAALREKFAANEAASGFVAQHVESARTRHLIGALAFERKQTEVANARDFGAIVEERSSRLAADETEYDRQVEAVKAAAAMLGRSEKERDHAMDVLAFRASEGLVERNPAAAADLLGRRLGMGRGPAGLTPDERAQWEKLPAGDREAYAEAVRRTRAAPDKQTIVVSGTVPAAPAGEPGKTGVEWIDRITVEQARALRVRAISLQREGMAAIQAVVRTTEADAREAAGRGEVRPIRSVDDYVAAYGEPGREAHRRASKIADHAETFAAMSPMSLAGIRSVLNKPLPAVGAPPGDYKDESDAQQIRRAEAGRILTRRQQDWISAASEQKIAKVAPIEWKSPDDDIAEMRRRQDVALMAPDYAGTPRPSGVLTVPESAGFRDSWSRLDGMTRARVLRSMKGALSDWRVFDATVAQIAPDDVVVQSAAGIAAQPGERSLSIASTLLRGDDILNPGKAARGEDGKPVGRAVALPADFDAVVGEALDEAMASNPGLRQTAKQAVAAYYAAIASDAGKFSKDKADSGLVKRAISDVIGEVVPWSGTGSFVAPWGMPADAARSALDRAYFEAMDRAGYGDQAMVARSRSRLIADPGAQGRYYIAAGDKPLKDKNGDLIVLDIRPPTLPPGLAERVPR